MVDYSIIGSVIDSHRQPAANLGVHVYHHPELLGSDVLVAETRTTASGEFSVGIPEGKLRGLWEKLGRAPRVFLTLSDATKKPILATRTSIIDWQLEYLIYLGGGQPEPKAPDIYGEGMRRMMSTIREVGTGAQMESSTMKTQLADGRMEKDARKSKLSFLKNDEERNDTLNTLFGVLDGFMTTNLEETPIKLVGYDGPQVPRRPWADPDEQVTIWPRKEPFRWA